MLVYNVREFVEGMPHMCVPCACAETPGDEVTQVVWGPDDQFYTGHSSGEPMIASCLIRTLITYARFKRILRGRKFLSNGTRRRCRAAMEAPGACTGIRPRHGRVC